MESKRKECLGQLGVVPGRVSEWLSRKLPMSIVGADINLLDEQWRCYAEFHVVWCRFRQM